MLSSARGGKGTKGRQAREVCMRKTSRGENCFATTSCENRETLFCPSGRLLSLMMSTPFRLRIVLGIAC
ncbi:hypothetical protein NDU88_003774 [Pleurodeles waltl]|uniref:Uncharacterized protein n=1 Tax=Pleurodeles waltl TaxID=8319 RepID=A0AAV7V1L3_PLEWA|nr:hypothetical protein NDU88_003774 [Pleurodeles waltl]